MDRQNNKTLTGKMIRLLLFGFFAAVLVFVSILWTGNEALDYYFIGSNLII